MSKTVLVLTYAGENELLLQTLTTALAARGAACLRFDTDRFPLTAQAAFRQESGAETLTFSDGQTRVDLGPDDVIWYRRSRIAGLLPKTMERQVREACLGESEALLRGIVAAAPCFVLDPPELVRKNGHKPQQQRIARAVGLETPRTLMTNDSDAARAFVQSCPHGAVTKMLSAFAIYDEKHTEKVVFTTALTPEHLHKLDGLRYCPMVFQERIAKHRELRITVLGRRIFAAAVDSARTPGAEVDWRERGVTLINDWTPYALPPAVEASLHAYMDRIGMQYSAIDMIVEPSGRHVFLEANPAGEFFWLQTCPPHFPLVDALADVLTDQPGARRAFP